MKPALRVLSAASAYAAAALAGTPAPAAERYIFLGDSLVDNRNSYIATTLVTPSNVVPLTPPYYDGRFSNGPNWTDKIAPNQLFYMDYYFSNPDCASENVSKGIAGSCGQTTDPGAQDGISLGFAFGGSRSGTQDLPTAAPGLLTVLDDLAAYNTAGVVASTRGATFALLTGGNDYTNYAASTTQTLSEQGVVDQTLDNIRTGLEKISALGAKRAIVINLFDLNRVPTLIADLSSSQVAQTGRLSDLHNAGLPSILADVRSRTGLDVVLVDLEALYDDIDARASLYGFTNTTGSCLKTDGSNTATGECPDTASENATLFWDGQHPTTAAHGYIAELVNSTIRAVDEDGGRIAALTDSGLMQQRALTQALRSQFDDWLGAPVFGASATAPVNRQIGRSTLFFVADNGFGSRASDGDFAGYDFDARTAVAGLAYSPADFAGNVLVGGHLGYVALDSSISGNGSFDNDAVALGGFAGWRDGPFSLALQATVMRLTLDDVKRSTGFSVMPTARSDTDGWSASSELEGRWNHKLRLGARDFGLTALGRLGAGWASIDGFTERDAGFLNLTVEDSDVAEIKAGIGLDAWTDIDTENGLLRPYLAIGYERDLLDDERDIDGSLSSGQTIHADSRAAAKNLFSIAGGVRFYAADGLRAEFRLAATLGAGGEESYLLPQLRIAKTF